MKKPLCKPKNCSPETILRRVPTQCSASSAQSAQLPRSLVQATQPENQSVLKKLPNFVNRAQLHQSPVPKKQQQNQPKTKTADIDTQ
jgi:hypothetical protein